MKPYQNSEGQIKYQPTTKNRKMIRWNESAPIWVPTKSNSPGDRPFLTSQAKARRLERLEERKQERRDEKNQVANDWTPLCKEDTE